MGLNLRILRLKKAVNYKNGIILWNISLLKCFCMVLESAISKGL